MFPRGVTVDVEMIKGQGFKYDITLQNSEPVTEINLEDIAAMESYQDVVNTGATVAATTITTVGGGIAGIALLKAVFGSCPTTYSIENGEPILEAESFSYSIAPGFEARDVDRVGIKFSGQSEIELEMRNEALETHYINHVELLEIEHAQNESVYPDPKGRPIVFGEVKEPRIVLDRSGHRVDHFVRAADGQAWSSTTERLRNVSMADMEDFIDVEFDLPTSAHDLALILNVRNSLLNTVLLYDVMLKRQGFRALDWMGRDLDRLLPKFSLARWYQKKMGMRIAVWDGDRFKNVMSVPDTGPIAWNEVAIPLPEIQSDKLRLRLSFIADNWRIDQIGLATDMRFGKAGKIPVTDVRSASGDELGRARMNLSAADDTYVVTYPGQYLRLRFDIGKPRADVVRTWFLAAEGYYIEWMRKEWLETSSAAAFSPGDEALLAALKLWEPQRDAFRERFESTKVSVR